MENSNNTNTPPNQTSLARLTNRANYYLTQATNLFWWLVPTSLTNRPLIANAPHTPVSTSNRFLVFVFGPASRLFPFFNVSSSPKNNPGEETTINNEAENVGQEITTAPPNSPIQSNAPLTILLPIEEEEEEGDNLSDEQELESTSHSLTLTSSLQTLKNKFITEAEGHTYITASIRKVVSNAIDKLPSGTQTLPNTSIIRAINILINNDLIITSELNNVSDNKQSEPTVFDSYFSLFSGSKTHSNGLSERLIETLVLCSKPEQTAQHLLNINTRCTLTADSFSQIQQLTDSHLLYLPELDNLLEILYSTCQRSKEASKDLDTICKCTTTDELNSYVDNLKIDSNTQDTLKASINSNVDAFSRLYSMEFKVPGIRQ